MISFHPLSAFSLWSLAVQWSRSCDKWVKVFDLLCLSATMCVCVCGCACMCVCVWQCYLFLIQVMSQARHSLIVRRGFHPLTSDVPVIQSNYTERNRYCYTLGIDSRQNRKVKRRLHSHLRPCATCWESHTHTHSLACAHRLKITWTNSFNISVITNPYKVTRPHFCLQWKVSGR